MSEFNASEEGRWSVAHCALYVDDMLCQLGLTRLDVQVIVTTTS